MENKDENSEPQEMQKMADPPIKDAEKDVLDYQPVKITASVSGSKDKENSQEGP